MNRRRVSHEPVKKDKGEHNSTRRAQHAAEGIEPRFLKEEQVRHRKNKIDNYNADKDKLVSSAKHDIVEGRKEAEISDEVKILWKVHVTGKPCLV